MAEAAKKKASYDDLFGIPENMTGEIIDGELIATPRPSARHSNVEFVLSARLGPPYRFAEGGPGGWVILIEQEIMLTDQLLVPDLSGWKKERFPGVPVKNYISVPPHWVCEVLSPGTVGIDKVKKMPVYAQHEIPYLWFVDPLAKTLEVFGLEAGRWFMLAAFTGAVRVRAEPFREAEIELENLWLD